MDAGLNKAESALGKSAPKNLVVVQGAFSLPLYLKKSPLPVSIDYGAIKGSSRDEIDW